ncbi:MAG: hypothetical protein HYT76_09620 [Deltaproteobacteria bacterium]|nr:hypothetical protein [Deltaproteobacteria bacterium]
MKRYSYFFEIPIFYLILVLINLVFFPHLPGYIDVDPHPYWLGILLFGFRYGISASLSVGILSAILYCGFGFFYIERYLLEDDSFYLLPACFILLGLFIGVVTDQSRKLISKLGGEKESLLKTIISLKEENKLLEEINQQFEKKIVTKMSTLVTLYEGARRLESLKKDELYHAILDFISKTLDVEEISLYLKSPEGWRLEKSLGWKEYQKRPALLKLNEGITGLAGSKNQIVTIRDFVSGQKKETPTLLGDALAAGPLREGEQGEVIGVISIQKMPLTSFNSASMNLFSFLLNWASRATGRARFIQELQESEILDPELQIYSYRYFESRLKQEFARSKTYALPLSVGLVQAKTETSLTSSKRLALWTALSQLLKESVREMDVVSHFEGTDIPFALILVTGSRKQTEEIREKILKGFDRLQLPVTLHLGFSSYLPAMNEMNELIQKAKEELGHV